MADGAAYLDANKVQEAIAAAVTKILKSRPADPITAIGQLLIAAGKASASLRKFPTTPVVQVGFTKAMPVSQLLEGKEKVPGLKKAEIDGRLEAAGIEKVYIFCVNDGAVMESWKKDQGLAASDLIEFVADTQAALTEALGIMLTGEGKSYGAGEGPNYALGFHTKRCKRSAIYVVDGEIKIFEISEKGPNGEFDPAGDSFPQSSCIENVLDLIAKL